MEGDLLRQTTTLGITRYKKIGFAVAADCGRLTLYDAQGGNILQELLVTQVQASPSQVTIAILSLCTAPTGFSRADWVFPIPCGGVAAVAKRTKVHAR